MSSPWHTLDEAVAAARALVAAHAPDKDLAAEGEAYVTRVVAAVLGASALGHLLREHGLSRPLPSYGGANPDYIMRHALIDPSCAYKLRGVLNGSERLGIGLYRPDPGGATPIEVGYKVIDGSSCDAVGGFAINLHVGAASPGALSVPLDARILLIRILHRDPLQEPARLRLEGGPSSTGLPSSASEVLPRVAHQVLANVREYLNWTEAVRAHPNRIERAPAALAAKVQGDPDTQYLLGSFDLEEGEYLEIEVPARIAGYWSVHAYNVWFEHLQVQGVHDRNAIRDDDGAYRLSVGPSVPTVKPNSIDTAGRRRGSLICRVIGSPPLEPFATSVRRA